jgi:serine/threonine protein kinase
MDRTGQVLEGKYRLVRAVGEGGMGSVYEARHLILDRRCAVKFLHPEIAHDPATITRFLQEAKAASAIGHRGIVEVYDFGQTADGTPYLVMEFLPGGALSALLAGGRKLPVSQAAEVVARTLLALSAAHRAGVIHRDLKPDNIFVEQTGPSSLAVKILDFGICRIDAPSQRGQHMTRTGAILGTPYYMAPEQAAASRDIDARLDLYAMGVILYECVTGRLPFDAPDIARLIMKILGDACPRPSELDPSLPPAVDQVVLRAMARDRAARYASAEEMVRALLPLLSAAARNRLDVDLVPSGQTRHPGAAGTVVRTCPTCGRTYDADCRFCPVDATPLGSAPPSSPSGALAAEAGPAVPTPCTAVPRKTTAAGKPPAAGSTRLVLILVAVVLALGIAVVLAVVLTRHPRDSGNRPGTPPRDLFVTLPAPDAGPPIADPQPSAADAATETPSTPPPDDAAAAAPPDDVASAPAEPEPTPDAARRDARVARDTARTPTPDATVVAPHPGLPERLSDDEVRRTFASIRGLIESCLAQAGGSGPGSVTVRATIAGRMGMVTAASVDGATGLAALCVRQTVKALRFPPFVQPTMTVTHPF